MPVRKSNEEVAEIRKAAVLLRDCLDLLVSEARPGMSGLGLDALAETFIRDNGAIPAFKGYAPTGKEYPNSICFSRNHVLVHGIPTAKDIIEEGDIVTIDCGLSINGWFSDAARLFGVGRVSPEDSDMISASEKVLAAGIKACIKENKLGDVCHALQLAIVESNYFNVYQFVGHAIGREMHESPQVPNYGRADTGIQLEPGMVFCLEPMLRKHRNTELAVLPDGWSIVTKDLSRCTHIEEMVLVTEGEPEVLTASVL